VSAPGFAGDERLLTFEVGTTVYALPIAAVHEVAEAKQVSCVPGLPVGQAGVMNWSGEALPPVGPRGRRGGVASGRDLR